MAMTNIINILLKDNQTIALVQEAYFHKNIIKVPSGINVFGVQMSRAYILAPSTVPLSLSYDYTTEDCTVCSLEIDKGKSNIFLASIYLDIKRHCIIPAMASFCNFLQRNNTKGIMCIDTNSWSTLWNSDSTNARGHLMDKWILGNNLDILNTEKTPTFLTSRAQSIIDVSLAYKAKNHISNWHVKNQYFFSDHRCIQFILFSKEFVPPTVQVTSWPSFRNALNLEEKRYKLWTRSIIEREAEALEGAINTALAASSANIPLRSNPTHFWNNDLEKSRRLSLNLDRHMQNRPSSSVKSDFENAKNIILKL